MAKKVIGEIKLQIPAGQANPSPPVGPALGQRGVNIMEFCKAFNAATQSQQGMIIPVIVTVYAVRASAIHVAQALEDMMKQHKGKIDCGELVTREKSAGRLLSGAVYARWSG